MRPTSSSADFGSALDAFGPAPRAELLHVLMLPTSSEPTGSASSGATRRAAPSPSSWDCEEDRTLRAVLVGMLRQPLFLTPVEDQEHSP